MAMHGDWVKKTRVDTYPTYKTTVWRKEVYAEIATPRPDDPKLIDLIMLGFRLHKMTDNSYRQLELFFVGTAVPMLKANLK